MLLVLLDHRWGCRGKKFTYYFRKHTYNVVARISQGEGHPGNSRASFRAQKDLRGHRFGYPMT